MTDMVSVIDGVASEPAGKLVHHRCGHPLWVVVLDRLTDWGDGFVAVGGESVVVCYRDAAADRLPVVFCCPGCGRPLKLWWSA